MSGELSDILWDSPNDRFFPHFLHDQGRLNIECLDEWQLSCWRSCLVKIFHETHENISGQVLINLQSPSTELPIFLPKYRQVYDIVPSDEILRQAARDRYTLCQEQGFPLNFIDASRWEERILDSTQ